MNWNVLTMLFVINEQSKMHEQILRNKGILKSKTVAKKPENNFFVDVFHSFKDVFDTFSGFLDKIEAKDKDRSIPLMIALGMMLGPVSLFYVSKTLGLIMTLMYMGLLALGLDIFGFLSTFNILIVILGIYEIRKRRNKMASSS